MGAQGTVKQVFDLAHIGQMIPLLPSEDAEALEALANDLGDRFEVQDAAGEILVRRLLQTTLQSNRLQNAQANLIQAKMHGMDVRHSF